MGARGPEVGIAVRTESQTLTFVGQLQSESSVKVIGRIYDENDTWIRLVIYFKR